MQCRLNYCPLTHGKNYIYMSNTGDTPFQNLLYHQSLVICASIHL